MAFRAGSGIETDNLLADQLSSMAERLQRSTVHVRSGRAGAGSGVIWQSDGVVITNAHVVRHTRPTVELWDGRTFDGEVIARDPNRDLAALAVGAAGLPAVSIGNSNALRVGQLVAAVGNPLGLSGALTLGIVHAIAPAEGHGAQRWVQADVRLAPGNSGGPLADIEGRVIGINSMVAGELGLAVPSNAVQTFLQTGGQRAALGVTVQPVEVAVDHGRRLGLLVLEVADGSPAQSAGIWIGDILVGADGRPFATPDGLGAALQSAGPDRRIQLDIVRGGVSATQVVTLQDAHHGGRSDREAA